MTSMTMILFSQLVMSAPMLLVYVGGMVLAALWWRRAPRAAAFAMTGLVLMLFVTIGSTAVHAYFVTNRAAATSATFGMTLSVIGLASGILRAVGMGLVVAAVFAGRPRVHGGGFDVAPAVPQPPLAGVAPEPVPHT